MKHKRSFLSYLGESYGSTWRWAYFILPLLPLLMGLESYSDILRNIREMTLLGWFGVALTLALHGRIGVLVPG